MVSNEKTHDVALDSEFEEPLVSKIYRELFHYTDWKGFEGIGHYQPLNLSAEVSKSDIQGEDIKAKTPSMTPN